MLFILLLQWKDKLETNSADVLWSHEADLMKLVEFEKKKHNLELIHANFHKIKINVSYF